MKFRIFCDFYYDLWYLYDEINIIIIIIIFIILDYLMYKNEKNIDFYIKEGMMNSIKN